MAQASHEAWDSLQKGLATFRKSILGNRATLVSSSTLKDEGKQLVQLYFRRTRPDLVALSCPQDQLLSLDAEMQVLLRLSNGNNRTTSYRNCLKTAQEVIQQIEYSRELQLGVSSHSPTPPAGELVNGIEARILGTLQKLVASAALSYEQALADLTGSTRLSYRGTATELRETLREVLDHLAPDKEVEKMEGFKLEPNQTKPTQKQKVRFILRSRGLPKTASKVPEDSLARAEELVGALARSIYDRGSISVHLGTSKQEVQKIKMYVESILAELLEIHGQ